VSSGTLGVDDTLGNPLSVKVRKQVDQVEVLQEERSVETGPLDSVRVALGRTVRGGVLAAGSAIVLEALDHSRLKSRLTSR